MAFVALLLPVPGYKNENVSEFKPREEGDPVPDNTGTYGGWWIRVKGDGRVEARDGNGLATIHHDVLEAKHWIDTYGAPEAPVEPIQPPDTGPTAPVIDSIAPASGVIDTPTDVTITGSGFDDTSSVELDGSGVVTTCVSDTELTASLPSVPAAQTYDVTVTTQGQVSNSMMFEVLDA